MISAGVRQALTLVVATFALEAQVVAPRAVAAPPGGSRELHEQLIERIQQTLARDGPYSPDLLEPLTALIVLYQEGEDDAAAAVAIERARQVVRVNNGLHTLEQVPLIRQLMRIEEERGNHTAVWDLEQDLLTLLRRYPDDLRTAPLLREVADRQMGTLAQYLDGTRPPELYLGCYYKTWPSFDEGDCDSGSRKTVVQGMLADAQRNYSAAVAVLLRNKLYGSDELHEIELDMLRGVDLVRRMYDDGPRDEGLPLVPGMASQLSWEPWRGRTAPLVELAGWDLPYFGSELVNSEKSRKLETRPDRIEDTYHRGRQILRRLYAYGAASGAPLPHQANAVVEMADWELLYSHNGLAVDGYELAYATLARLDIAEQSIQKIFAPATPVLLPVFQPNPLARDETRVATGHIDVAFEITQYGRGRAVEILETVNATDDAKDRLVGLIANGRFRPRPIDGRFAGASRVVARYHVYDGGQD